MGFVAFLVIAGPWCALIALLWFSRDRLAGLQLEALYRPAPKPVESKMSSPPSPIEQIREVQPDAEPAQGPKTGLPEHDPKR